MGWKNKKKKKNLSKILLIALGPDILLSFTVDEWEELLPARSHIWTLFGISFILSLPLAHPIPTPPVKGDMKIYSGFEFRKKNHDSVQKRLNWHSYTHTHRCIYTQSWKTFQGFNRLKKSLHSSFLQAFLSVIEEFAKRALRTHISSIPIDIIHKM